MEGIQPTYNMAQGDGFGFGGGSGIWLFAILALFLFGNGGMWGNRASNVATQDDLNFSRLENQVQNGFTQMGNGICELGYKTQADFAQIDKSILENRFLSAQNTASINATTTAQTQKILDAICQNKIEAMQSRINQLELAQATCNVLRYPTSTVYSSGCNPFCGCGCGYGNI